MKNVKLIVAVLLVIVMVLAVVACEVKPDDKNNNNGDLILGLADGATLVFKVGDTDVDFTQYFSIKYTDGTSVTVTNDMLDLSKIDLSQEGTYPIILSYNGTLLTFNVKVEASEPPVPPTPEVPLQDILDKYADSANWNFIIEMVVYEDGDLYSSDYFGYNGTDIMYKFEETDLDGVSTVYTDYIIPTDDDDVWYKYYSDMGNGKYKVVDITEDLYDTMYFPEIWLDNINTFEFTQEDDHYVANDPQSFGDEVYGSAIGVVYTKAELYTKDGEITKLVFLSDETYNNKTHKVESIFTLTQHGTLDFDISKLVIDNGDDPVVDPTDINSILKSYENPANWNFVVNSAVSYDGELEYEEEFSHLGNILRYAHGNDSDSTDLTTYVDYIVYNSELSYTHYGDLGGGLYEITNIDEYNYGYIYFPMLYLDYLSSCSFNLVGDHYEAVDPQTCGDNVYGSADGCTYTKLELYVSDGKITKLVFFSDEVYYEETYKCEAVFEISAYGTVDFDISSLDVVYGDGIENPDELKDVFAKYEDDLAWNFGIDATVEEDGETVISLAFGYAGEDAFIMSNDGTGLSYDYFVYDEESDHYWVLLNNGDGTHTRYTDEELMFYYTYGQFFPLSVNDLAKCPFVWVYDHYEALYPEVAGNNVYGAEDTCTYTAVELYVSNGLIEKVVFIATIAGYDENDNYVSYVETTTFNFVSYNEIVVDISGLTIVDDEGGDDPFKPDDPVDNDEALQEVFDKYADMENWNFAITFEQIENGEPYSDYYEYYKYLAACKYGEGNIYADYLSYDPTTNTYSLWLLDEDDTYVTISANDEDFYDYFYEYYFADPSILSYFEFEEGDGFFSAKTPNDVGEYFIGYFGDDYYWTTFVITIANGDFKTIEATLSDGTLFRYTFSKFGEISLELPEEGGNNNNDDTNSSTTTFIGANLAVGKGELGYTSTVGANSLDVNRGLQFLQSNGEVVLTSVSSVDGIVSVKLVVNTNADKGMNVSVKIGGVFLTSDGQTSVFVAKHNQLDPVNLTFVSSTALSGKVEVILTPKQTKSSMYISSITLVKENGQGGENPTPNPNPNPSNVMENQNYNPETFDHENLQDKMSKDDYIGLPSSGDINVLVVPVQFSGYTISQSDLAKLNLALNGTEQDTGWESVKTYYNKSSYGNLNLSFDIQNVFSAPNNSKYYEDYHSNVVNSYGDQYTEYGSDLLLRQVLAYYEPLLDLTKYDSDGDGCIDAVYLIYSAPVDYVDYDFYWAYTTWYYGEESYDDLYAYYYLFAGFDFMDENVNETDMKIDATTYIHETGHLLGLDDYYDYYPNEGSDMGLGYCDMMDDTIGDHNAYSKIMLGWTEATIVNSTTTLTIGNFESTGNCILVPLNFNNSYFCEYLLIDLYSATGLNEFSSEALYDGASYGVRIYHVSSSINDPYGNEYGSFTDNDNSKSKYALIKLVEADGEYNYNSSDGYATDNDLWQAGDSLSNAFVSYTRNDGKVVNFDITINSVSATEASITITFAE